MGQAAGCMGLRREFCGGRTAGGAVGGDGIRIWNLGAGGVARGKGSRKESADSTVLRPFAASFQVSDLRAAPLVGTWAAEADSAVLPRGLSAQASRAPGCLRWGGGGGPNTEDHAGHDACGTQ